MQTFVTTTENTFINGKFIRKITVEPCGDDVAMIIAHISAESMYSQHLVPADFTQGKRCQLSQALPREAATDLARNLTAMLSSGGTLTIDDGELYRSSPVFNSINTTIQTRKITN